STSPQTTQKNNPVSIPVNNPGETTQPTTQATTPWGVVTLPPGLSPEQFSELLKQLQPPAGVCAREMLN
ncbi:hypothetical protein MUP77_07610, partial [Candidatus Bathyarchaeota archaeon]|nr:hypothetical protein [Candidatus Bathyarchaeota archaeon]